MLMRNDMASKLIRIRINIVVGRSRLVIFGIWKEFGQLQKGDND